MEIKTTVFIVTKRLASLILTQSLLSVRALSLPVILCLVHYAVTWQKG